MDIVEYLHQAALKESGGLAGKINPAGLESALHRPREHHYYRGESDLFQLAAIYAEGIIRNHPYCDGNKRTAFSTADFFLDYNGYDLEKSEDKEKEHYTMTEQLAIRAITCQEYAEHLRKYSKKIVDL